MTDNSDKKHREKQKRISRQTASIKDVLVKYFEASGMNIHQVCNCLSEPQFCGKHIYDNTLSRALYQDTALDIDIVLGLCRLWKIPYDQIFARKHEAETSGGGSIQNTSANITKSGGLIDPSYMHSYYGYHYTRNEKSKSVAQFVLTMSRENGVPGAKLECISQSELQGTKRSQNITYEGIPIVIGSEQSAVFIEFSKPDGGYIHFYFHYQEYRSQQMYFRKGFIITKGSASKKPIFQHCLLFFGDQPPSLSEDLIKGMLRIDNKTFTIAKEIAEELKMDGRFSGFFDRYDKHINIEEVCRINEIEVLNAASDYGRYGPESEQVTSAIETLMAIKARSDSPSHIVESNDIEYVKFVKKHLDN
jgi:hypothetical protein